MIDNFEDILHKYINIEISQFDFLKKSFRHLHKISGNGIEYKKICIMKKNYNFYKSKTFEV